MRTTLGRSAVCSVAACFLALATPGAPESFPPDPLLEQMSPAASLQADQVREPSTVSTANDGPAQSTQVQEASPVRQVVEQKVEPPKGAPETAPAGQAQKVSSAAQDSTRATSEVALTNEEIVALSKADLGDEVIIAKIKQVQRVAFRIEGGDLMKLKSDGVSQAVIAAMINRTSTPPDSPHSPPPSRQEPDLPRMVAGPMGFESRDVGTVRLTTKDRGDVELSSIGGSMSTTYAYVMVLVHMDYPNLRASVRTLDRRPSLVVTCAKNPMGRYYIVKAESDDDDGVRSVKLGNAGAFTAKNMGSPDKDNQIPYEVVEESSGSWRLTPRRDLKPGEYGLWIPTMEIFDFGVDK